MATVFARTDPHLDSGLVEGLRSRLPGLAGLWGRRDGAADGIDQAFVIAEVNALIHHATENGLDRDGSITVPLFQAVQRYRGLDPARRVGDEGVTSAAEILRLYTQLCALPELAGISGRTLIYARSVMRHIRGLVLWGVLFVALAAGTEILLLHTAQQPAGAAALPAWLPEVVDVALLHYLNPFFWGGVGACVFLVKSISDKAAMLTFDRMRMHGVGARIFLGAVIGGLLVNGAGLNSIEAGGVPATITSAGVAFLGGLGVKAIYAAFEALIDEFEDRIAGSARRQPGAAS
jgi:hypothetical protein